MRILGIKKSINKILDRNLVAVLIDCLTFIFVVTFTAFLDVKFLTISSSILLFVFNFFYDISSRKKINNLTICILSFKILFIIDSLLSAIWSVNYADTIYYSFTVILRFIVFLDIYDYIANKNNFNKANKFLLIGAIILTIRLILVVPFSAYGNDRIGNYLAFNSDSTYGNTQLTYVYGLITCILLFDKKLINNPFLKVPLIVIFSLFSFLSGSKKQLFFLIIMFIVYIYQIGKKKKKLFEYFLISFIFCIVLLVLVFNVDLLYDSIGRRLETFFNAFTGGESDLSTINRIKFLQDALNTFLKYPIFGVGTDCFKYFNTTTLAWAENNFLELLADLGIVGFLLYYSPYFYVAYLLFLKKPIYIKDSKYFLMSFLFLLIFIELTMVTYRNNCLQFFSGYFFGSLNMLSSKTPKTIILKRGRMVS